MQACTRGCRKAVNTKLEQNNTPFVLSFSQRSSEGRIGPPTHPGKKIRVGHATWVKLFRLGLDRWAKLFPYLILTEHEWECFEIDYYLNAWNALIWSNPVTQDVFLFSNVSVHFHVRRGKSFINRKPVNLSRIYLIQHVLIVPLYLFRRNIIFCETVLRSSDSYYIVFSEWFPPRWVSLF